MAGCGHRAPLQEGHGDGKENAGLTGTVAPCRAAQGLRREGPCRLGPFDADGAEAGPVETISLSFAKVDLEYKPQKADGSVDAGLHFKYDLKSNKVG